MNVKATAARQYRAIVSIAPPHRSVSRQTCRLRGGLQLLAKHSACLLRNSRAGLVLRARAFPKPNRRNFPGA